MIKFYDSMGPSQGIAALSDVVDALDFWQDNTAVKIGDIARSSTNSMIYAVAQTAGVTGTVEPVWGSTADVTITDNTVTWLVKDIRTADAAKSAAKWTAPIKINGIDVDGSHDITLPTDTIDGGSYIGSGLKVSSFDGLNVNISSGRAKVAGNGINFPGGQLALNPRKASLMYLDSAGTLGKVDCANPLDFVDDNTVGMWIFNQTVAGANIPNSAVGKSAIAVANDLVPHGGIASVDGWFDKALQLDGTTGYLVGSNSTNFPTGAAERELTICFNLDGSVSNTPHLCGFGVAATNQAFFIHIGTNGNLCFDYSSSYDTGYNIDKSKKLTVTFKHDGTKLYTYANGTPLGNPLTITLATGLSTLYVGNYLNGSYYAPMTVDYIELRNKMRSDAATAAMANKMMFPCFYDKATPAYPTIPSDYAATYHEYRMDETSGTAVADSNTLAALNGTATGTTIVDSDLSLGKARKFNGSDYVGVGNYTLPADFTLIHVGRHQWDGTSRDIIGGYISSSSGVLIHYRSGKLRLWINGNTLDSNTSLATDKVSFYAAVVKSNQATLYIDSQQPDIVGTITSTGSVSMPFYLGHTPSGHSGDIGTHEYDVVIPAALTQAEIAQIYTALMTTGRRSILDDVIPANAISLGFVRTNSTKVIEKNDRWYKYGRREGAHGGNRREFLPWKYMALALKWDNPFGTPKYKSETHWAEDARGTNEVRCPSYYMNSTTGYGVRVDSAGSGMNDTQNITLCISGGGVAFVNGVWKTTGYLGVYVECLEGVEAV